MVKERGGYSCRSATAGPTPPTCASPATPPTDWPSAMGWCGCSRPASGRRRPSHARPTRPPFAPPATPTSTSPTPSPAATTASPPAGPHPGVIDINVECMVEEEDADADAGVDVDDEEADSWLLLSQAKNGENHEVGNGYLYDQREVNEYLDLVEYNSTAEEQYNQQQQQCKDEQYGASGEGKKMMMSSDGSDSVVPVQCSGGNELHR